MLGYALFSALYGPSFIYAFATADMGHLAFAFAALAAAAASGGSGAKAKALLVLRQFWTSPVFIAIAAGLLSAAVVPGAKGLPWAKDGFLAPTLTVVGSSTTPLVCLVVGYSLRNGFGVAKHWGGFLGCVKAAVARFFAAFAVGSVVALVIVPALGLGKAYPLAVLTLFLLPPPFAVREKRSANPDSGYVNMVITLHTYASLIAVFIVAILSGGSL
jgi:predicted permease